LSGTQQALPDLTTSEVVNIIELWTSEYEQLSAQHFIKHIQIFENKGEIMGCSNPHPHGQIWAQTSIPVEVAKETSQQKKYFEENGVSLLKEYVSLELKLCERVVYENEFFVVLVPFWATWPFETIVVSKRHIKSLLEFSPEEKEELALALRALTQTYDRLFNISFPYSAGIHQSPVNDGPHDEWHWHMHFYPPLLRSATVKKFMVGYELLGNPQRDITPESAADRLRSLLHSQ
jgi:UDPglucose--hexose-1-phosphate uridylyltransferase